MELIFVFKNVFFLFLPAYYHTMVFKEYLKNSKNICIISL